MAEFEILLDVTVENDVITVNNTTVKDVTPEPSGDLVLLTGLSDGDEVTSNLVLEVFTDVSLNVDHVDLYVDEELRSTQFAAPYNFTVAFSSLSAGSHSIVAQAITDDEPQSSDVIFFNVSGSQQGNVAVVNSAPAAIAEYDRAAPGDSVLLEPGDYDLHGFDMDRPGVFFGANTPGTAVIISSRIDVSADGNNIADLRFEDSDLRITSDDNIVQDCEFSGGGQTFNYNIEIREASRNLIENCEIRDSLEKGISIVPDFKSTQSGQESDTTTQDNVIRRCYIHDFPSNGGNTVNGTEPLQSGDGSGASYANTRTIVEDCLFEDCFRDGEVISNKTSGNIYRRNTLVNSSNSPSVVLNMRHGTNSVVHGCWLNRIRLYAFGDNHSFVANRVRNADIRIQAGDGPNERVPPGAPNSISGQHPTARRTDVVANTVTGGNIIVGATNNGSQDVEDTFLTANSIASSRSNETGTSEGGAYNAANANNPVLPIITPVELTPADVGVRTF